MPTRTATLDDVSISKFALMGYGPPGSGKTHFIKYLPEPFVFDFDHGLATLATLPKDERPAGIQFLPHPGAPDLTYDQLMILTTRIAQDPTAFGKTLVVDTFTELQRQLLVTEARKHKRELDLPIQEDYNPVQHKLMTFLTTLLKLPQHVYVIAHEQKYFDRSGNVFAIEPDFSKSVTKMMPRYFDEVYYFTNMGTGNYQILTSGNGIAYAKTRLHMGENLSHKRLAEALLKTRTGEAAPLEEPVAAPVLKTLTK